MLLSTGPAATTNFAYNTDELFADAGLADAEGTLAQLHGRFYAQAYRITRRFHAQDVEAELARRRELLVSCAGARAHPSRDLGRASTPLPSGRRA